MKGARTRSPFALSIEHLSEDTVEVLRQLHAEAESGLIVGFAGAIIYRRREIVVGATGEAVRNPVFARGALCSLDDHLRDLLSHH